MREIIKDFGPTLVSFLALFVSALSALLVSDINRRTLVQKQQDDERKEIYKKLNSFYGPFRQLLGKSFELYGLFTRSREPDFRTLTALLAGEKFEGNDKILLEQILKITDEMDKLILNNSGLIDDEGLKQVLQKASAHFTILKLASEGHIAGEQERFKDHVFPRDLTPKIEEEISRLKNRLDQLNTEVYRSVFKRIFTR